MTFAQAFAPAVNKDGYSKLTFKGLEVKTGTSTAKDKNGNEITDIETGEIKTRDWTLVNLTFEVMGRLKGTSQVVPVSVGEKYSPDNILGRTLQAMGFVLPEVETVADSDGFEVVELPEDDDGFGQTEDDLGTSVEDFLAEVVGKSYMAKVSKATEGKRKGFWVVDVDSIKPLNKG